MLRNVVRITSQTCIPSCHQIDTFFNRKISMYSKYTCAFSHSERVNLMARWALVWEVIRTTFLRGMDLLKFTFIIGLSLTIVACASRTYLRNANPYLVKTRQTSELQLAKLRFDAGYYKCAKLILLPLACDGNAEAQYGLGYMYYYGYGVTQDTEVGAFWISRSATQGYPTAKLALCIIEGNNEVNARDTCRRSIFLDKPPRCIREGRKS